MSDGQFQRAAMARTLATKPDFIILDDWILRQRQR
ncbi:ATP-binding cassette domain-containing protein [Klebsiella pneumoniae]|nr:ATP-binding cassette domain-containing protein [Klebsiella pneumoniae]HBZ0070021.1 ATP-binding cassette domain-containing protein [Klebsiella pneumoniae subsp. ozaenae]HDU3803843.1 ATP-binding cassette domain-containing protein [Klebsiella pneumoniae subsp. pneumoniae]AYJ96625.1 ATP-binding cassette domain-containing protein [Klebsiella pneumoniae]MCW8294756.1 ATP-binding cassette domain-containing protein [Klebsiella pneumoniae]PUH28092.1 hypothetical protein DBP86_09790 [Klebsiella pneumo